MKIGIVAGEASGDLLGAGLIHALKEKYPSIEIAGVGGPAMKKAGCDILFESERLAVMGFIEPLFRLRDLLHIRKELKKYFLANRPQIFIGIDSPDFNIGLELFLKKAGIPTIHYVSPSVWAWRKKRIHKIKKAVNSVLTLFPFEKNFYDEYQVEAHFVGHPLADTIPLEIDQLTAKKKLGLATDKIYVALLPGSRQNELRYMGETFIKTAQYCVAKRNDIEFITSSINLKRDEEFKKMWEKVNPTLPLHFFQQRSHAVMAASNVVLVSSGTATLETLLHKRPMVIVYQTSFLTYQIAKWLVDLPFIGLPNLLSNEKIVPEFIQQDATPSQLGNALLDFLDDSKKVRLLEKQFTTIHKRLRKNASQEAARVIETYLN